MKREYKTTEQLRAEYGTNKNIPESLEEVILKALSHFPELKNTRIDFKLRDDVDKAHSTTPSKLSLLAGAGRRSYTVNILTQSGAAMEDILVKNLPFEAQIAAIAHELAHIVQFEQGGAARALRMVMHGGDKKRERERKADISVIEHGLGFELYTYATYARQTNNYPEDRRKLDVNHLHPNEILEALPPEQLQEIHRF